jgi:streptogramin lyase
LGSLRPHDAVGAMAEAPGGGMLALYGASIASYGSAAPRADSDFLSYRLPGNAYFWPQGIAVAADGTVYLSQDGQAGIGPPAIVEQSSSGRVSVLWGPGPA